MLERHLLPSYSHLILRRNAGLVAAVVVRGLERMVALAALAGIMAAVVAVVAARSQGIPPALVALVAMALFILWSGK